GSVGGGDRGPGGDRRAGHQSPQPAGSADAEVATWKRARLPLDRREGDIGKRARWPLAPRSGPTPRLKRVGEEAFERWVERAGGAGGVDRGPQLMKDLILADDHGVA